MVYTDINTLRRTYFQRCQVHIFIVGVKLKGGLNMSKQILLSQDQVAVVDDEDYDYLLSLGKWTFHSQGYAYRWDRTVTPNKCLLMHRVIMNTPEGKDTDHINGNKLDNRKDNLRAVSRTLNNYNKETLGIESSPHWSGYVVRLTHHYKRYYIGRFNDLFEAKQASYMVKEQLMEVEL